MLMDRESALGRTPPLLCELEKPLLISRSAVSVTNTMTRNFSSPRMIVRKDVTHKCYVSHLSSWQRCRRPPLDYLWRQRLLQYIRERYNLSKNKRRSQEDRTRLWGTGHVLGDRLRLRKRGFVPVILASRLLGGARCCCLCPRRDCLLLYGGHKWISERSLLLDIGHCWLRLARLRRFLK